MLDDEVLLADRRKAVAAMIADAFGKARIIGNEQQIGPVDRDHFLQVVERQHAVDQERLVVAHRHRSLHEAPQIFRHRLFEFEPDHRSAAATLQHGFERAHEIFRFFLDFDFGIADDPEGADAVHGIARE